jgi:hypothetical protein
MSKGSEIKSPAAMELRELGYVPLPRWWVKREDMDYIAKLAQIHAPEVAAIRKKHNKGNDK